MISDHSHSSSVEQHATNESKCSLRILIADDHPVVRAGLIAEISRHFDMEVVAEAKDGHEAVAKALAQVPDVCLIDLRMPLMDGIDVIVRILEKRPTACLVVLSSYETQEDVYRAMEAGAKGYLLKEAPMEEIVDCIRAVSRGQTWIPSKLGAHLAKRIAEHELTPRESEVLRELSAGKSNKEIGVAFEISEGTVKVHVSHILEKLNVTSRTEAINAALKRGIVRFD
ncbi:MAG: DNA-binding response regulator [Acidobacteria bacterium]|nr:MAG: DNA-binding response regulator [Acidobacteriota bacterium]